MYLEGVLKYSDPRPVPGTVEMPDKKAWRRSGGRRWSVQVSG